MGRWCRCAALAAVGQQSCGQGTNQLPLSDHVTNASAPTVGRDHFSWDWGRRQFRPAVQPASPPAAALQSYTGGVPAQVAQMIQRQVGSTWLHCPAPALVGFGIDSAHCCHWAGVAWQLATGPALVWQQRWR